MEKDIILEECNQKSSGMTGKHHTEETKQKISESMKGKISWNKGKTTSKETKKKISESEKGKIVSNETKQKLSEVKKGKPSGMKDKHQSKEAKEKISKSLKGNTNRKDKCHTEGTKEKMRISTIKYIELTGPIYPNIGRNETKILNNLELKFGYNIIRQFPIGGFFLDGYIPELNLAIEVDEKAHENQKEKDILREEFIKEKLNCEFLRIKDY